MLDASAVTSAGLLYTLFHWSEISRTEARSEHCLGYLKKISINSLSLLSSSGGGRCYLENNETINFDGAGVCNLFENLHWCHGSIRDSFAAVWSEMRVLIKNNRNGLMCHELLRLNPPHRVISKKCLFLRKCKPWMRKLCCIKPDSATSHE